jgi:type III secretion system YopN/LcrE/InvE/MxiC family regulator
MKASDHLPALMELLAKLTPDPAKQYLLLAAALDAALDRRDVAAKLSDAMRRLIEQHGPEIRAGLNTHEVASMFAADVEPVGRNAAATQYRAAYRAVVLETNSLPVLFKCLLKDFGDRYAAGIDHLLRGIGLELRSIAPSTDRTRLNDSLQVVYLLQAATTVLQRCVPVCRHLEAAGVKLASSTLAYEFAELLSQKPLRASTLNQVALRLGASANEGQLILLHGILSLFRLTPMKLFSEPEQRLQVITTIQIVLDQKIYVEEKEKDDAQREKERKERWRHRDPGDSNDEDEDNAGGRSQHGEKQ